MGQLTPEERRKLHALRTRETRCPNILYGKARMPKEPVKYGSAILVALGIILLACGVFLLGEIRFPHLRNVWSLDFWLPIQ